MRRLSTIQYPDRYCYCIHCKQEYINDSSTNSIRCPNDMTMMVAFDTLEAFEKFKAKSVQQQEA